jgi:putative Holliday junction resolvase
MGRTLGIDHGDRRIGLALSDALGIAAHGLPTVVYSSVAEALAEIQRIVRERDVSELVVGLPRNMDGSLGPQAKKAQEFGEALGRALGLPVHFVDERLTSEQAERTLTEAGLSRRKRRDRVDRMAAQLILQQHLQRRRLPPVSEGPAP